ncbi:hypothetical protein DFH11DRAFT_1619300 [Phellopilus nigrolimitatus]|nr:hypothetical protein DFH11DRAFT_1619300 [Phellopilus nigrolimitatus]
MVFQSAPSSKALGKRPARGRATTAASSRTVMTPSGGSLGPDDDLDDCSAPPSTAGSVHTRTNQKRVLPTRARRGGPGAGIGTSDTDMNILDMLKRRGESEPLIPSKTVFILTTDSRFVPSASTSELGLNPYANERYFDRPEVIKAYKDQQNIQTPEFTQLTDEEMVGGRLRARSGEVESADLSDAAYEKRHRKHEILEKRQRLREKEKLQHEHYKLKERIDQLRATDYAAFLTLPADSFEHERPSVDEELEYIAGVSTSSTTAFNEGERRRRLMLDVATSLEERYRTLLPLERKFHEKDKQSSRMGSMSAEPSLPDELLDGNEETAELDLEGTDSVSSGRSKPIKLKLRLRPPTVPSSPSPLADVPRTTRRQRGVSDPAIAQEVPPPTMKTLPVEGSITITALHSTSAARTRSRTANRKEPSPPIPIYRQDNESVSTSAIASPGPPTSEYSDPSYMVPTYPDTDHSVPSYQDPSHLDSNHLEPAYPSFNYPISTYSMSHHPVPRAELRVHHLGPEDFIGRPHKKPRTSHTNVHRTPLATEHIPDAQLTPAGLVPSLPPAESAQAEPSAPPERYVPIAPPEQYFHTVSPVPYEPSLKYVQQESLSLPGHVPPPPQHKPAFPSVPRDTLSQKELHEPALAPAQREPSASLTQARHVTLPAEIEQTPPPMQYEETLQQTGDERAVSLVQSEHEQIEPTVEHESTAPSKQRRESTVPVLSAASVPSSRTSHDKSSTQPRRRKQRRKHMPCIMVAASHYEGMGRKTGRSILPFGTEMPNFSQEIEFELPAWMTEGVDVVALMRAASTETDEGAFTYDPGFVDGAVQDSASGFDQNGMSVDTHVHLPMDS